MRPTRAEIDLSAIAENVTFACRLASPQAQVMAVVKADAYGHGAVHVAKTAIDAGATWLGVATPEEAVPLRAAGIVSPILVLGPIAPDQAELVAVQDLDQCVSDPDQAKSLDRAGRIRKHVVRLHLKVDTGMGRVGVRPREVRHTVDKIYALSCVRLVGLMTHFAEAEAEEPAFAREQLVRFSEASKDVAAAGLGRLIRHAANSAGLLFLPEARLDLVRPGIMLYGYHPRGRLGGTDPPLRPGLRFRTAISQIRDVVRGESVSYGRTFVASQDIRVATLPVGYADGFDRLLSNRGSVLVRGKRAPIVGRICMDMTMIDVSRIPDVRAGDEAVMIGRQGNDEISANEVAEMLGTISYEVLCRIGPRVPRVYLPPSPSV